MFDIRVNNSNPDLNIGLFPNGVDHWLSYYTYSPSHVSSDSLCFLKVGNIYMTLTTEESPSGKCNKYFTIDKLIRNEYKRGLVIEWGELVKECMKE